MNQLDIIKMALFNNINFDKLKNGLTKTRSKIVNGINEVISGKAILDEDTLDEIEEILVTSDIGVDLAIEIMDKAREELRSEKDRSKFNIIEAIKSELNRVVAEYADSVSEDVKIEQYKPFVILVVGVNGAGKTTTIGKLAQNYKNSGLQVMVGAADTFRAAANEQLEVWAKRAGVEIFTSKLGADPSSVAFETLTAAKKKNVDVVMIDTAGRLNTKNDLMQELSKIKRVIAKVIDYAPNEVYLVVDGNTGQNALIQAKEFSKYTDLTGLIVTKLDGTAKGGMIFQICKEYKIPVKFVGIGEGIDDLQTFDPANYLDALFEV